MTAQQKVTNEEVRKALEEWGGNLTAAADALGLRPKNLRERALRLGIDLDALRKGAGSYDPYRTPSERMARIDRPGTYGPGPSVSRDTYGSKSGPARLLGGGGPSTVQPMQTAAATREAESENEGPVRGISGPAKPIRVRPPFQERLRAAKVDLIGRHRVDTDEQHVFDQFCDEAFEPWLAAKLEPAPAAPKPPRKRTDKGGTE